MSRAWGIVAIVVLIFKVEKSATNCNHCLIVGGLFEKKGIICRNGFFCRSCIKRKWS
jgi:hypothetical protein